MGNGIISGGGVPDGKGWRAWLRSLVQMVFPRGPKR